MSWLQPRQGGALGLTDDAGRSWISEQRGGHLFISIVLSNPVDAYLIRRGKLTGTDIGISIHCVLEVDRPHVVVGSTPVHIDQGAHANVFSDSGALVLSLGFFDLEDMLKVRHWQTVSTKVMFNKDDLADGTRTPAGPHVDVQSQVLAQDLRSLGRPDLRRPI